MWLRVWGVALLGVGKRLRDTKKGQRQVLTTFRMADTVKEMLTMVGMLKFVTGRKAFLFKTLNPEQWCTSRSGQTRCS